MLVNWGPCSSCGAAAGVACTEPLTPVEIKALPADKRARRTKPLTLHGYLVVHGARVFTLVTGWPQWVPDMVMAVPFDTPLSSRWPRYTGPRCGVCQASLTLDGDGFMVGCEHAGVSRNLTMAEQFALRRAPAVEVVVVEHPAPQVPMREAEPREIWRGVNQVLAKVSPPWKVRTMYSRGTVASGAKVVDSVVVRFAHPDGRRGWAGWVDGKADGAFIYDGTGWVDAIGVTDLKALLSQPERQEQP